MNYLDIQHCNMVNGDGLRTVIWVSGCERKCKNCFQPHTHDINSGIKFDKQAKEELFKDNYEEWCSGVTILGGEPLHPQNRKEIIKLAKELKEQFPNKTIWLYTGYTWSEIVDDTSMREIIKYVDIICDGPYIDELRNVDLKWVGSSNQSVIDVKERIEKITNLKKDIYKI
jgi:anaerobic ribonucleoside-triphosphate reductase activating protein